MGPDAMILVFWMMSFKLNWAKILGCLKLEIPEKDRSKNDNFFSLFSVLVYAAAAKSLQLCPTLCDPIGGSPPCSPVLGFSGQEHWSGCHFLLQWVQVKSLSHVRLLATPWTSAYQAPPSMGFSGKSTGVGYIAFSFWLNSIFLFILDVVMFWWINTQDRRNKVAKLEIKPKVGAVRVAVF